MNLYIFFFLVSEFKKNINNDILIGKHISGALDKYLLIKQMSDTLS